MAQIINKSSGWNEASKSVFPELLTRSCTTDLHLKALTEAVVQACSVGNCVGTPMLITHEAGGLLEQALNQLDDAASIEDLAALYETISGTPLKQSA